MTRFKVDVDSDVYKGSYYGESLEKMEMGGKTVIIVNREDGSFTAHRDVYVDSIELDE